MLENRPREQIFAANRERMKKISAYQNLRNNWRIYLENNLGRTFLWSESGYRLKFAFGSNCRNAEFDSLVSKSKEPCRKVLEKLRLKKKW